MDISISVDSDRGEADLRSLHQWLLKEPALREVRFERPAPVPPWDEMGSVSEILLASFGAGGAGAVLANSVSVWLQNRVTQVRVRVEGPHGSVEVEAGNVRDPAALIERILREHPGTSTDTADAAGGADPDGAP